VRSSSKKQQLREYLDSNRPRQIGEPEWNELRARLGPISDRYLRELLHATGVRFEQPFAGVRQGSFAELEESLREMGDVYAAAMEAGDRQKARHCRNVVIQSKDHARLASKRATASPEKKAIKEEMVRWMLVWLENPAIFPEWATLRKKAAGFDWAGPALPEATATRSSSP
jgi:hypothetical protein